MSKRVVGNVVGLPSAGGTGGDESNIVHRTGDEEISGVKSFKDKVRVRTIGNFNTTEGHDGVAMVELKEGTNLTASAKMICGGANISLEGYNNEGNVEHIIKLNGRTFLNGEEIKLDKVETDYWVKPCICGKREIVGVELTQDYGYTTLHSIELKLLDGDPTTFDELINPQTGAPLPDRKLNIENLNIDTNYVCVMSYTYNDDKNTVTFNLFYDTTSSLFYEDDIIGKYAYFGTLPSSPDTTKKTKILLKVQDTEHFDNSEYKWITQLTPDEISGEINTHNQSSAAHSDIRKMITEIKTSEIDETNLVHKSGDEEISGIKTFTDGIRVNEIKDEYGLTISAGDGSLVLKSESDTLDLRFGAHFSLNGDMTINGDVVATKKDLEDIGNVDTDVVHKTGDEEIGGKKTFTELLNAPGISTGERLELIGDGVDIRSGSPIYLTSQNGVYVNDKEVATKEDIENIEIPESGGITEETDPTVPDWAKQPEKPTYTADEVGALPSDTLIIKEEDIARIINETVDFYGRKTFYDGINTYSIFNDGNIDIGTSYGYKIKFGSDVSIKDKEVATKEDIATAIGDVETALDNIITIQNSLMGGDGV